MVAWLRLSRSQRLTAAPLLDPSPTAVGRSISKKECLTRARSATSLAHLPCPRAPHPSAPRPSVLELPPWIQAPGISDHRPMLLGSSSIARGEQENDRGGWGPKILDFLLYYRHRCERGLGRGPPFRCILPTGGFLPRRSSTGGRLTRGFVRTASCQCSGDVCQVPRFVRTLVERLVTRSILSSLKERDLHPPRVIFITYTL